MRLPVLRGVLATMLAGALIFTACSDDGDVFSDKGMTAVDADMGNDGGASDSFSKSLPDGFIPYKCTNVGKSCNAHDPCAFNPVCGADLKCWPEYLMDCNDKLDCTVDKCMGLGVCSNLPKEGFCRVMYKTGIDDGGVGITEAKCVTVGTRKPDDPCMGCSPTQYDGGAANNTKWMPVSGGSCDDKDQCTQSDTCVGGVCKGTSFLKKCADTYGCTKDLCDGKGGCLGNTLMDGWCIIGSICYKKGGKKPDGSCNECDPSVSTSAWTPISNTCKIDSKCYNKGDLNNGKCAKCDPAVSTSSWTALSGRCFISNVCKKPGDLDTIKCAKCDPTTNQYAWTPLSGVCKINSKCYTKAAKHPLGCAECDPTASSTSWTVSGSYCLVNNKCYNPKAQDSIKCGECVPTTSKYKWTPIAGLCKISGTCYKKNDTHPGKCAQCLPSISATSWTVPSTTNECLINNVCKKPADKDLSGCGQCSPSSSKYAWTSLTGVCKIDGSCYQSAAKHPKGCATCSPSSSATSWTASANYCVIDQQCIASGAKDTTGCGVCTPSSSKTSWTVSGKCIVGPKKCVSTAAKEPGGCGVCNPAKNAGGWTPDTNCKAVHAWSKSWGGTSSDYGYAVATDASGNVYVAGSFYNTITLGGTSHTSKGGMDIYLVSYTPSGQYRWSKSFGSTSTDYAYGLDVDGAGNVNMTGMFYVSISFGGTTLTSKGSYDMYVASFDSSGKHRWSKSFGSTSSDYGYAIDSDASGNVYVTGFFYYSANFGGSTLTSKGGNDIFLASFDSSGKHRWSKSFGGTSSDYGYGLAVDGSGNVYITGYFYNSINFGGSTLSGVYDIYLASFTPAGVHRWSKAFGGTSSDYGWGLAVDKAGNVYMTGYFYNSVNFGGSALSSSGSYDAYIASFTPAGTHRWSKAFGSTSSDYGYGVTTDAKGNAYVTGYFYNSIKFGSTTHTSKGSGDMYVASFDSTGNYRWSRTNGTTSSDYGRALAVDLAGDLYVTGYFYGTYTMDLGGGPMTGTSYDAYVVKYDQ